MKKLYFIRHAQAQGQAPEAPLTLLGEKQAEKLADFLMEHKIERIVTSPYVRAVKTVELLGNRLNMEITVDERLVERVLSSEVLPDWLERFEGNL